MPCVWCSQRARQRQRREHAAPHAAGLQGTQELAAHARSARLCAVLTRADVARVRGCRPCRDAAGCAAATEVCAAGCD
eukprot:3285780-Rhodomonas_salina.1